MKRGEIQKRLKDIIANTHQVIERLKSKQEWFKELKLKLDDLDQHVAVQGKDLFHKEEALHEICYSFFEAEFSDISCETEELKTDIEAYADSLSEARADAVYEQYAKFEDVLLLMDEDEYTNIELAIKGLEEAIGILEELHK